MILGAIITGGVIVQRLTDYVWVGMDFGFKRTSHYARRTGIPRTEDQPGETTLILRGPEPHQRSSCWFTLLSLNHFLS